MGSLIKLVYVLIVLSIAADVINLGGNWFNTNPNGGEISVRSSSLFLPGADGSLGKIVKAAVYLTKSAIKAAKRHAKNQAKARGNARNKARRSQGGSEHTKNARKSTKDKHQRGQARRNRDRG
ncbi:hypothetical protein OS493_005317 [Desmophyllum pertusum]|uniref:Uncharacterized protein n=1 Tax=Desmophyllum pertusum TaxID=174260 RepID=A0A9W9Z4I4_9CNID|nr:hypothetical protein OS493_005317 [Desmophyllum pertusum]